MEGLSLHDDVFKWKYFPRYWPFVRGIHRWPVNSPHKGQWRGALVFSLICAWISGWVNDRGVGDLRRHRAHYDVTVMIFEWGPGFRGNSSTWPLISEFRVSLTETGAKATSWEDISAKYEDILDLLYDPSVVNRNLTLQKMMNSGTEEWRDIIETQLQRQQTMKRFCENKYPSLRQWTDECVGKNKSSADCITKPHRTGIFKLREVVIHDLKSQPEFQTMFCVIPKAGSTFFKRMLVNISQHGESPEEAAWAVVHVDKRLADHDIDSLGLLSEEEQRYRLRTYNKVLVVRHPLARLLSAFRSKSPKVEWRPLMQRIVSTQRTRATKEEISAGKPTFEEFLRFLIASITHGISLNEHWAFFSTLCDPCHVTYDYICHQETLENDVAFLRQAVFEGSPSASMLPHKSDMTDADIMRKYYADVANSTIEKIIELYRDDFTMFGYNPHIAEL